MGDVLAAVDLDEMGAEVLGHLLELVWPVPVRRDAAIPFRRFIIVIQYIVHYHTPGPGGRRVCEESRSGWEAPRNDDVHGPCDDSRDGEEAMVREGMTSQERGQSGEPNKVEGGSERLASGRAKVKGQSGDGSAAAGARRSSTKAGGERVARFGW